MKLHMDWSLKRSQSTRTAAPASELRQRVGGVLAESLGVLGERLGTSLRGRDGRSDQVGMSRLREVLDRDRALLAANPEERGLDESELGLATKSARTQVTSLAAPLPAAARTAEIAQAIESELARFMQPSEPAELATPCPDPRTMAIQAEHAPAANDILVPTPEEAARPSPATVVCREPIRTRTMARLLASQGHRDRALSIYDHLLARSPDDEGLRAEADALRAAES